jgi:methylenetetrahydrofolate reductase (NADPH)
MSETSRIPVSVEFFPPKTPEGVEKLRAVRQQLYALKPEFCSVTFGAGGSTQEGTFNAVREILAEGVSAASHFSCIGATPVRRCARNWPRSRAWASSAWWPCAATCPVVMARVASSTTPVIWWLFIRAETGDDFHIEVAAYPETHPQAKSPPVTCRPLPPRFARVPIRPLPSISTTPMPTSALSKTLPQWA